MKLHKYRKKQILPSTIFFICSLSGILLFFSLCLFRRGGYLMQWIAMENNSDFAMLDYFQLIVRSQSLQDLGREAYLPPLGFLFFHFIGRITCDGPILNGVPQMPQIPYQMMIFLVYTAAGIVLFARAVDGMKISRARKNLLVFCMIFSVPMFAGVIERGNIVLYVVSILLIAFHWKDSSKAWQREGALILIALAANLKIYPAVMGLMYISEKRWKEALRLIVYGMLFFFVPILLFKDLGAAGEYLRALSVLMGGSYEGRVQFFKGLLSFWHILGGTADVANMAFAASLITGILLTKCEVRRMAYLAAFMAMVPANAYRYTLLYFLLPLSVLFSEDDCTAENVANAVLLGLLFSIPAVFGIMTGFRLNYGIYTYTYVERYIYTAAWLFVGCQFLGDMTSKIKERSDE